MPEGDQERGGSDRDESGRVLAEETWTHSGLRCRVVKLGMGHYCGYVRSMFDDRWTYDDFQGWPHNLIDIHGGLTYGVDEDGWLGFDFGHAYDYCVDEDGEPWGTMPRVSSREKDSVWTLDDVKEETEKLAEQVDVLQDFVEKVERYLHPDTDPTPTLDDDVFADLLELVMVSDPWPLDGAAEDRVIDLLDDEAKRRGYDDGWIQAYHAPNRGRGDTT